MSLAHVVVPRLFPATPFAARAIAAHLGTGNTALELPEEKPPQDVWFHKEVMPRLKGRAFLIRYADDAVMGFVREDDARRVQDVLPKRRCSLRNRMRETCTYGSAGAPGEQSPGATRPGSGTRILVGFAVL